MKENEIVAFILRTSRLIILPKQIDRISKTEQDFLYLSKELRVMNQMQIIMMISSKNGRKDRMRFENGTWQKRKMLHISCTISGSHSTSTIWEYIYKYYTHMDYSMRKHDANSILSPKTAVHRSAEFMVVMMHFEKPSSLELMTKIHCDWSFV